MNTPANTTTPPEKETTTGDSPVNLSVRKSAISVNDLTRSKCGFFVCDCSRADADAISRGEQTAIIVDSFVHIQKDDLFVFAPNLGPTTPSSFHNLSKVVFTATFISAVPNSSPAQSMVCFRVKSGYTFHEGGVYGEYLDDTITFDDAFNITIDTTPYNIHSKA